MLLTYALCVLVKVQDFKNNCILKVLFQIALCVFNYDPWPHHRDFYAPFHLIPESAPWFSSYCCCCRLDGVCVCMRACVCCGSERSTVQSVCG